jgi:hypothetical protein
MTEAQPPTPEESDDRTAQAAHEEDEKDNDSVVSPPAYPAYSTPPPRGLHTGEDG